MNSLLSFVSGVIFGIGLGVSQMTRPEKVLGFLNALGDWDPSLLVVLFSAVSLYATGYVFLKNVQGKLSSCKPLPPVKVGIDRKLIAGAALFGVGWGIAGLCPGPALVDLISGQGKVFAFVGAMSLGLATGDKVSSLSLSLGSGLQEENWD